MIDPKIDRIPILPEAAAALLERFHLSCLSGNAEFLFQGKILLLRCLFKEAFKMPVNMIVCGFHTLWIRCPQGLHGCGYQPAEGVALLQRGGLFGQGAHRGNIIVVQRPI